MKTFSLKVRLQFLLGTAFVVPLLFLWLFTNYQINLLYRENTDVLIDRELNQIKTNMDVLMDSLKYTSQQIITDRKIDSNLRNLLNPQTSEVEKVNSLQYIRDQLTIYEISNSNISNITFFAKNKAGKIHKINETSLLITDLPTEQMRLTTQNQMIYYGPHTTYSRVSDYAVISLVRNIDLISAPSISLYIESGFRQLDEMSTKILDKLGAVYTVFSDTGVVIYSSQPDQIPQYKSLAESSVFMDPHKYRSYQEEGWSGWSLRVFVPLQAYKQYLYTLSLGFVVFGLIAAVLGILAAGFIWRTIYRPLRLFE